MSPVNQEAPDQKVMTKITPSDSGEFTDLPGQDTKPSRGQGWSRKLAINIGRFSEPLRRYIRPAAGFRHFGLVLYADLIRSIKENVTYRTQMVLGLLTGVVSLVQFGILGFYISLGGTPPGLDKYGDNIIAFMIIGNLFNALSMLMMNSLKGQIQAEQGRGTLEAIALTRAGIFRFALAGSVFGFISTIISAVIIVSIFGNVFNFEYDINVLGLIASILMAAVGMWSIGLCAAAYILVSKKGEPITWIVTTFLALFSGVMFPLSVFPDWLARIAMLFPTAGMLHAIRISLFDGATNAEVAMALSTTIVMTVILLPLGLFMWNYCIDRVRREGTLGTY